MFWQYWQHFIIVENWESKHRMLILRILVDDNSNDQMLMSLPLFFFGDYFSLVMIFSLRTNLQVAIGWAYCVETGMHCLKTLCWWFWMRHILHNIVDGRFLVFSFSIVTDFTDCDTHSSKSVYISHVKQTQRFSGDSSNIVWGIHIDRSSLAIRSRFRHATDYPKLIIIINKDLILISNWWVLMYI